MNRLQALARADELLRQRQLAPAELICRRQLEVNPDDTDAAHLLGLIYKQAGNLQAAERWLKHSVRSAPDRAIYHSNLGNLLRMLGKHTEAEAAYRSALHVEPGLRLARLGLARLLNDLSRHVEAEAEARELILWASRDAESWSTLGMALRGRGLTSEAVAAYRTALDIAPSYGVVHHNLGVLLAQMDRAEEALDQLRDAWSCGVRGREISSNLGRVFYDLSRFDEAEAALEAALAADPARIDTQMQLANLRFMRGDPEFDRGLVQGLQSRPEDVGLRIAYANVVSRLGNPAAAEEILRCHADSTPEVIAARAVQLNELGRNSEAVQLAQAACDARPGNSEFKEAFVVILLSMGRAFEALPIVRAQRKALPLHQSWIAYESDALRAIGDDSYRLLYDYDRFVRYYDLGAPVGWTSIQGFNADLGSVLDRLHTLRYPPLEQSLRCGTQTPRSLLAENEPIIKVFLRSIESPIAAYRSALGVDSGHPLLKRNIGPSRLSSCWSVRLSRGGHHVNHVHPTGWISSVYYVSVPPEVSIPGGRNGWIKFGESPHNVPNAGAGHFIEPKAGRLILFPSYMWHGTVPISGDDSRLTIAFDVVPNADACD